MKIPMLRHFSIRLGAEVIARALCLSGFALGILGHAHAQNVTVNPGAGSYADLKTAFDAINAGTHTGALTVSIIGNTTETASAVLNASGSGAASYSSVVISPAGGAARTISGSVVGPLLDLNGADNVTINGLNTGGNALTISNLATGAASTLRLIGDASSNLITNVSLLGSGTTTTVGTVFFSTGTTTGNDGNTLSNCSIGPAGSNLPVNGVLSLGSASPAENSADTIQNCNISDFFNAASVTTGVLISTGNSDWTLSGNRLFQTASRTYTTANTHNGIQISSGNGHSVTGNVVGFSNPAGTGVYTMVGTIATRFIGINLAVGTVAASSVQGNTVAGISLNTSSGASTVNGVLCGINVTSGNANIGTVTANTIGASSGTGSLSVASTTSGALVVAINSSSTGTITIQGNSIGALASSGVTATIAGSVTGINVSGVAASMTISGNTVGNATADNMRGGTSGLTTGSSLVSGINLPSSPTVATITNNIVQNLSSFGTGSTGLVRGIGTASATGSAAVFTITGNTISNLASDNANNSIGNGVAGAFGINLGVGSNSTVSSNLISNIARTNTGTTGGWSAGITHGNATNTTISRNRIFDIRNANTSVTAAAPGIAAGIVIRSGTNTLTIANNMISLGSGQTTNTSFIGIQANHGSTPDPIDQIYFNSINVTGVAAAGAQPSFGFLRGDLTTTTRTAAVDFRNNIVTNDRSGGTGAHYAIANNFGATVSALGWGVNASNFNALNANAATVGHWGANQTFAGWQVASTGDVSSYSGIAVNYVNAANDLHLTMGVTPTVLESGGTAIAGISTDFDAQTRPGPTGSVNGGAFAPDLGADEFDGVYLDGTAPTISYANLTNTSLTSNRNLVVTISDITGVATGGFAPRIYYRKNAGPYFSQACGLTSGSTINGTWNCLVNNADLGGVTLADVVSYFVVAQDTLGNLRANPFVGFSGTNVNTLLSPPTTPNAYTIVTPAAAAINVGSGEAITSLTNAGGLFAALNSGVFTGNVVVNITSDLTAETGAIALNAFNEKPTGGNFTLKIVPIGAPRLISGAFNGALIRLNGASRVTIDGSLGGTGTDRSLTIQNTSTTTPSVLLIGSVGTTPITNSTLKNSIIINGATTNSAVVISDATTSGAAGFFSNITVQNNDVQKAFIGVFANGGTTPANGSNLVYTQNTLNTAGVNAIRNVGLYMQGVNGATVSQNAIGNFSNIEGENDTGIWLAAGTANATVSTNTVSNLGMTLTTAFAPFGIRESSSLAAAGSNFNGNMVSSLTTTGNAAIRGISVSSGGVVIQNNKIQGVINNNLTTFGAYGIDVSAGNNNVIQNNFVSDINHNMSGGGAFDEVFGVVGIRLGAGTGHKVYFNSVNLFGPHTGTATASLLSTAFSISSTAQTGIDVRNNIFANNITGGTTSVAHVSVFLPTAATSAMNLTMNNNAYYFGTDVARQGAGQAGITAGTNFFTTLPLLAAYTSTLSGAATNDNASIAPLALVPFASDTDLHVAVASAVVNLGTPIVGISTDIDGDPRTAPAPEIGADELVDPNTAPNITPAVGVTRQQGTAASNSTIATVSDLEQPAGSLVVTAPSVPAGLTLSSIANATGTVTANLVAACTATLGANTVGLSVSDGLLSTAGNLSVNVTANSAPVLGSYTSTSLLIGTGTTINPSAAPTDNGSIVALSAAAPGFTGSFVGNTGTGVITISNAGPASVTPYVVTVSATDNCGLTSTASFNLTVNAANTAPTITPASGVTRQQGSATSNSTIAAVSDAEQTAGSLTVTAPTVPAGLTLGSIVNSAGTVTANLAAACTATLGANAVGLSVSDGALSTAGSLSVNVTANSAPVLGTYPAATVAGAGATTVNPATAPTDNGSVVTLSAAAPGFSGTLTGNPATGVISVSAAGPASLTPYLVTVTATDNCGLTSTRSFNLTVNNVADLDVSKTDGVSTYRPGDLLVYTIALRNLGPDAANGVVFTDVVPATLINASWTCAAANGAACPLASGNGNINATIATLPATGRVTYTLQANVAAPTPAQVVNTAQVSLGTLPIQDPNLLNNSATDTDLADAVFSNGFEDPVLRAIDNSIGFEVLPLAQLQTLIDDTARVLFSINDANGEALRIYARRTATGEIELAIAMLNKDGVLQLGAWQLFAAIDVRLGYSATATNIGFVLQSARLD
jgi:hypothetical protein